MSDHDGDIPAADELALTDLFASQVADAPASEVSPLEIVKLGRIEQRHALDVRIRRFKLVRNVLVAAAFAALVVLIVPHLGSSSSDSAAAASSSSSAAATFAPSSGSAPQQGSAAAAGSAASGSAASERPAGSGAMSAGSSAASAASAPAASAPASGAMSSGAAVPDAAGATKGVTTTSPRGATSAAATSSAPAASGTACPALPTRALAAFESAFPAGYFGALLPPFTQSSNQASRCSLFESRLPVVNHSVTAFVTVRRAPAGACGGECRLQSGHPGIYLGNGGGPLAYLSPVYVYADGYEVAVLTSRTGSSPAGPTFDQLVAGARAVIKTLG